LFYDPTAWRRSHILFPLDNLSSPESFHIYTQDQGL
jgi:hypothetical protein